MLFPEKADIKTKKASLSLKPAGFVKVVYKDEEVIRKSDYLEVLGTVKEMCEGVKLPALIIYPENAIFSRDLIEGGCLKEKKDSIIAEAFVVKSFKTRFWINYHGSQNGDGFPVKAFRTEEGAMNWLSGFLMN